MGAGPSTVVHYLQLAKNSLHTGNLIRIVSKCGTIVQVRKLGVVAVHAFPAARIV